MTTDIITVMWKEIKILFHLHGGRRIGALLPFLSPLFLAIYLPSRAGTEWLSNGGSTVLAILMSVMAVATTIPDAFAGERERHTLETLLASRLPGRIILFGKIAVVMVFALCLVLVLLLVSLVTVNILHWEGKILFFDPTVILADLVLGFLSAMFVASAGILISLRSNTAQGAMQLLMAVLFIPPMLLSMILLLLGDEGRDFLRNLDSTQLLLIIVAALVVADVGLFAVVLARFRRSRLFLD